MSHITIIISKGLTPDEQSGGRTEASYSYHMPVPDGATPRQVGEMVRCAYRALEGYPEVEREQS